MPNGMRQPRSAPRTSGSSTTREPAAPNAAPIQKLPLMTSGPAAHPRGDELLDRRVDRGVLAANAGAGEEPEEGIAPASLHEKAVSAAATG